MCKRGLGGKRGGAVCVRDRVWGGGDKRRGVRVG